MIQRIQSVYLLLVLTLSIVLFFVNMYSVETADPAVGSASFYVLSNTIFLILNSAVALFSLAAIFLYKNRMLQVRLSNLNMLVICIFIGTVFYFADHSKSNEASIVHYHAGCYFPLMQLVFTFLAIRAIRKDEQLVRSADRLR
jgi:hypothetical protein